MGDEVAAWLEDLRARNEAFGEGAAEVPRLFAALDAVLELAGQWSAKAQEIGAQISYENTEGAVAGFKMIGYQNHRDHAEALRTAISRALLGEGDSSA